MSSRHIRAWITAVVLVSAAALGENPPAPPAGGQPLTHETWVLLIRSLDAEYVFMRKALPMGFKGLELHDGVMKPDDAELQQLVAEYGAAVKPGDRVQITNVRKKAHSLLIELNGGQKKKSKWYDHVQVGMGGVAPVTPERNTQNPTGSAIELVFDKFVPEMTGDQVRALLAPVLDFHSLSAAEAYLDTVPPKVKQAIQQHQVLVGMNRDMVSYAKGRPDKKIRERDESGTEYEDWMYGEPPAEVQFVRFVGEQVVRLTIMAVDGEKIVRTQKEVELAAPEAKKQEELAPRPANAPTLRRPGEPADDGTLPGKNPGAADPGPGSVPWNNPPLPAPSKPVSNR